MCQTHLIKSFVDLSKWKSERIAPKYYAKRDATTLNFDKNTPLVVKWIKMVIQNKGFRIVELINVRFCK